MRGLDALLGAGPQGRIFINYRRSDAQWMAARLADSLSAYFGDQRVFRDIEHIAGGAKFDDVIANTLGGADAVIVVIGPDWLSVKNADGQQRLTAEGDWVAVEIATALEQEVPVFPVLVEDTPMPRTDELPPALQALSRYNAISISDSRWDEDVTRLAQIVALDIPSQTERRLRAVNVLTSGYLALFVTLLVSWAAYASVGAFGFNVVDFKDSACPTNPGWAFIGKKQASILYVVIAMASALLFVAVPWTTKARHRYVLAAGLVGAIGTLMGWILVAFLCKEFEPLLGFFGSIVTATWMLALMSLSGFKPK